MAAVLVHGGLKAYAGGSADILWSNTLTGDHAVWAINGAAMETNTYIGNTSVDWVVSGTGDFNGDGKSDFLWTNRVTGDRAVWLMNRNIAIGGGYLGTVPVAWVASGTGDFDGDGKADVFWTNTVTGERSIWLMNGSVVGGGDTLGVVSLDWTVSAIGDFNGDGKSDVLLSNKKTGDRVMWCMNGVKVAKNAFVGSVPVDWVISGTGDFNGDGRSDILWTNTTTGDRAVWLMNGSVAIGGGYLGAVPVAWVMSGTGDFNGDGKSDIFWSNTVTGERSVWFMDGIAAIGGGSLGTVPKEWIVSGTGALGYNSPVAASVADASRFLIQASFGPTAGSISEVVATSFTAWIFSQTALAPTYHMPYYKARVAELLGRTSGNDGYLTPRQEGWWQNAIIAPDQLRQRMAFALSEIVVVSQDSSLEDDNEGVTAYYDLLVKNAFGNYRQLLDDVTLSPIMGTYLSMIRNQKPNVATGQQPDENYAREIMQLFTIGLSELNLDGSLQLDSAGNPLPTYTQADIVGLAHVFTGWGPHFDAANPPKWSDGSVAKATDWFRYGWDALQPMTFSTTYGDLQNRQIVGGVIVPGTLTGPQRLKLALDTLFNHHNVGPFLARQLIQRFVTSNPSPAYISRVASAFNDNGAGVRGDLAATLRAVLLDPEARSAGSLTDVHFGKLTEPLVRMTRLLRAFPLTPRPYAGSGDNRMFLNFVYSMDEQSPLYAPTVFNFFKPGFSEPGLISDAGLVSPEFQIFDDVTAMLETNRNYSFINSGISVGEPVGTGTTMKLDLSEPLAILTAPGRTHPDAQAALVDYFNQRLMGGTMSAFLRQKILDMYTSLGTSYTYTAANELRRVQIGLYLVMFSPEFNVQH
ncbi:MAG: DUF1800 family protein [Lacunisphaera sp.]